jgi:secondary thiamine-phosphate synthase enzyme
MEAVVSARGFGHAHIRIATDHPTQFIDLTDRLEALVAQSGIRFGFVNVQSLHTTAGIVVNENEPLLLSDFAKVLERSAPAHAVYRHDDLALRTVNLTADERVNGHAHCRALILGLSACINVIYGRLHLGAWQRVFLVELDGPRDREISVLILGEGDR